jgi:predicted RNA-binding Zn-ribbon protein involved in translation (DUF1610 family)
MKKIKKNALQCLKCSDIIESVHRHDFVYCSCKNIAVDGGKNYLKRVGPSLIKYRDFKELSEYHKCQSCGTDIEWYSSNSVSGWHCPKCNKEYDEEQLSTRSSTIHKTDQ